MATLSDEELGAAFRVIVLWWPSLLRRLQTRLAVAQLGDEQDLVRALGVAVEVLQEELDNASSV